MAHEALWDAISTALDKKCWDEAAVAAAAAAPRHALSPWALWMLIGVARHLRRQGRVRELVRDTLGVDLDAVGRSGRVELVQALHAPNPVARADAVAILALLDEPWCASTLAGALDTSADADLSLEWRAGLAILNDPAKAARAWEAAHPLTDDDRTFAVRCEVWIRERMRALRNEVEPIRAQRATAAKAQKLA